MRINIRVAYLDGRNPDGKVDFVEFINNETDVFGADPLVLLYRSVWPSLPLLLWLSGPRT